MNTTIIPPALLITGSQEATIQQTVTLLQKQFCPEACAACIQCKTVASKQHHGALWFYPEKRYTLETIAPISKITTLQLQPHEHFFFIVERAELLTPACANSLLKLIEEPPHGYHFIFLAPQQQLVITTIRSRCHLVRTEETITVKPSGFMRHFMEQQTNPALFLKEIALEAPEDHEVSSCIALLITHWTDRLIRALAQHDETTTLYARWMLVLLQKGIDQPPMPGSAKLFWKELFLQKGALRI